MNSPDSAFLRHVLATRVRPEAPTPQCVGDDVLAAMAAGTLDPAERAQVLPHVAGCVHCRGAVASVARALADRAVAREVRAAGAGPWRRVLRVVVPAAAAAAVLLLVWPRPTDDVTHRAPPITAVAAPVPMWPVGLVTDVESLRWAAVAGADRYRVTLFRSDGQVLFEVQVTDTVAALPQSVRLAAGRPYLWKVEARTGFERWAGSGLVEFSIAPARPQ